MNMDITDRKISRPKKYIGPDNAIKLKEGRMYIAHNRQVWQGFNLVRGHAYGIICGESYVSGAEPDHDKKGRIMIYKRIEYNDCYRWVKLSVSSSSTLAQAVLTAIKNSPYPRVMFPERTNFRNSKPYFPTYRTKRPDVMPSLPKPEPVHTWVDRIFQSASI